MRVACTEYDDRRHIRFEPKVPNVDELVADAKLADRLFCVVRSMSIKHKDSTVEAVQGRYKLIDGGGLLKSNGGLVFPAVATDLQRICQDIAQFIVLGERTDNKN